MFILLRAPNCAATIWGWRLIEEIRYMHYPRDSLLHVVGTGMVDLVSLFTQKLSYRIPTAALAVPPIAFSHSSGQLYTKKDHTTHDTILMIYVRTHVHHSLVHFPFPAYINIHVSTPFPHWPYFDPPNQSKNISPAWIEPWASSAEESKVGEK